MTTDEVSSVRPAVERAKSFAGDLTDQLDESQGGFRCWRGHTDRPRLILLGDYLIQSVNGVAESLLDASLSCLDHKSALTADNFWVVSQGANLTASNPYATNDDHLTAQKRSQREESRDRRISMTADSCLIYLVQCLDRLSATLAIVGGLNLNVLKVGWSEIEKMASPGALAPPKQARKAVNALPGEEGLAFQAELMSSVATWRDFGPEDWLPWLLQTRNARAHRAQPTSWRFLTVDKGAATGLCRPFYRRPWLSEMHSAVTTIFGPRLDDHLLIEESSDVLRGLCISTSEFAAYLLDEIARGWARRQEQPCLVVQPGSQWKMEIDTPADFAGFGVAAKTQRNAPLHVPPSLAKRLTAAKAMDDAFSVWDEA